MRVITYSVKITNFSSRDSHDAPSTLRQVVTRDMQDK